MSEGLLGSPEPVGPGKAEQPGRHPRRSSLRRGGWTLQQQRDALEPEGPAALLGRPASREQLLSWDLLPPAEQQQGRGGSTAGGLQDMSALEAQSLEEPQEGPAASRQGRSSVAAAGQRPRVSRSSSQGKSEGGRRRGCGWQTSLCQSAAIRYNKLPTKETFNVKKVPRPVSPTPTGQGPAAGSAASAVRQAAIESSEAVAAGEESGADDALPRALRRPATAVQGHGGRLGEDLGDRLAAALERSAAPPRSAPASASPSRSVSPRGSEAGVPPTSVPAGEAGAASSATAGMGFAEFQLMLGDPLRPHRARAPPAPPAAARQGGETAAEPAAAVEGPCAPTTTLASNEAEEAPPSPPPPSPLPPPPPTPPSSPAESGPGSPWRQELDQSAAASAGRRANSRAGRRPAQARPLPHGVQQWLEAAAREQDPPSKARVIRKALEMIPGSARLWREAVGLEADPEARRALLARAVGSAPQSVELWLALARLSGFKDAQRVLAAARKQVPTSVTLWAAAARLEEAHGSAKLVEPIIERAAGAVPQDREAWLRQAEEAEKLGLGRTCQAIVKATMKMDTDADDESMQQVWAREARAAAGRGAVEVARAIYWNGLAQIKGDPTLYWQLQELEARCPASPSHGAAQPGAW